MPGRSTIPYRFPPRVHIPRARLTVLPLQLPVCCFMPVRALKSVLANVWVAAKGYNRLILHRLHPFL